MPHAPPTSAGCSSSSAAFLHVDGVAGIAGDMVLGALVDLGVPLEHLAERLGTLTVGGWSIDARRVVAHGLAATRVLVRVEDSRDDAHGHADGHGHGADDVHHADPGHGRSFAEVVSVIAGSGLSQRVKTCAIEVFRRLCAAEAAVHGTTLEQVHLHEAGAVDALVDVCGTAIGLEWLGWPEVSCDPPELGGGTIRCRHGVLPAPGPATLRLLEGRPVRSSEGAPQVELTTPTGAALLATLATRWDGRPAMVIDRVGLGAGSRELPDRANVVRLTLGRAQPDSATDSSAPPSPSDSVAVIEADVDDADPQILAAFCDSARALGALDATLSSVLMKKGRAGTRLTLLVPEGLRPRIVDALFESTTTIGCRWHVVRRETCARATRTVETPWGPVRVKVATWNGRVVNRKPEHEDCLALAASAEVPLKQVVAAALAADLAPDPTRPAALPTTELPTP